MSSDPIVDLRDRMPVSRGRVRTGCGPSAGPVPFGVRFAVSAVETGKHGKTYYTVTVQEATEVSRDGGVITITDSVQRERED
ncbi:MAG: hypothetical protein ACRDQ5_02835 [Sciscionella sp.]